MLRFTALALFMQSRALRRALALGAAGLAASCGPQATDDYAARDYAVPGVAAESRDAKGRAAPSAPISSPDTEQALWFASRDPARLLYGIAGSRPMLVFACEEGGPTAHIRIVRRAPVDPGAKALMAFIGNSQIQRLKMNASWTGHDWVWEGSFAANDPRLKVFVGRGAVEATVPGGGSLVLKPSPLPARVIAACAERAAAPSTASAARPMAAPST